MARSPGDSGGPGGTLLTRARLARRSAKLSGERRGGPRPGLSVLPPHPALAEQPGVLEGSRRGSAAQPSARAQMLGRRSATGLLCLGALLLVLDAAGLLGNQEVTFLTLYGVLALAALPAGIYLNRPQRRWPWALFFVGGVLFAVDYQLRTVYHTFGNLGPTRSLVPDLLAVPAYLVICAALTALVRAAETGSRGPDIDLVLDGVIAALGALTVAWAYVVGPLLIHTGYPLTNRLIQSVYPIIDVYLVAIAFRLDFAPFAKRTLSNIYMLAAVLSLLAGDVLYSMGELKDIVVPPVILNGPYLLMVAFFGAAVLHPSMKILSDGPSVDEDASRSPVRTRLMVVAVALALPAILVVGTGHLDAEDRVLVAVFLAGTVVAASIRLYRALDRSARTEEQLHYEATHDSLTGLPNRVSAERFISRHLTSPVGEDEQEDLALVFLDLDRFKLVNDTFGHTHGDLLLVEVARRLAAVIDEGDMLARIGGDEFVIVVAHDTKPEALRAYAQTIRRCFDTPFPVHESEFFVTASIGVSVASRSDPMSDTEKVIRDADTAMYQAKDAGRDAVVMFNVSMRDKVTNRLELEHDLRLAVERDEFFLDYQPILSLGPAEAVQVVGLEALLRWEHPMRGLISPGEFIGIAEETGSIVDIGAWVIAEACHQVAEWRGGERGLEEVFVSVNLSSGQLNAPSLVPLIGRLLHRHDLDPRALCLELTESLLMDNPTKGTAILNRLRASGVRLAIDDFGTGYSSLAYLRQFSVDYVKIDQSFIMDLTEPDTANETLVAAIVAMAEALHSATIAEGVEYAAQAERLRNLGCTMVQGHHYACPLPPTLVPDVVRRLTSGPHLSILQRS